MLEDFISDGTNVIQTFQQIEIIMMINGKLVIRLSIKLVGFSHIYIYKMKIFPGFQ